MPLKPTRRETLAQVGAAALALHATATSASSQPLTIGGKAVELKLVPYTSRTLRISLRTVLPGGQTEPLRADDVIVASPTLPPMLTTRALDTPVSFGWGRFRVRISNPPLALSVEDSAGKTIQSLRIDAVTGEVSFRHGSGPVFGLGEGGPQFDRGGNRYTLQNGQFMPDKRIQGARLLIPWLVGSDGWALFFHEPFGTFDLTGPEGRFEPSDASAAAPFDCFLVVSDQPAAILKEYALLTGFPHMPPLWSLGFQQSHRTLESRAEIMNEAKAFRDKRLPCDTLIYLGTGFSPSGWNTGHGSFTFNEKVFPDPANMIRELHEQHFHVILHLTRPPAILHGTVADSGEVAKDVNDAARYWAAHQEVFRLGVDGWWPDEGDTLSPQSRLARNRMYWEGPLQQRPGQRPWALHRNGYAGMQRYGWLWSGDVNSDWQALRAQIPVALNTGLSGIPYWGSDTGGFVPTKELSGELYVRWFQFSSFCPLFRAHGRNWKLHLPWGWATGQFGPLETEESNLPDPSELHNTAVEPICRKYLDLRYQMMPYLYSLVREAHQTGMPIMRALWLHYPNDEQAVRIGDQYLWGRDILVAPVIERSATRRHLYLPHGRWYDFWTGERVEGGRFIDRGVDLGTLPLYVRGGAILPFGPVRQWTGQAAEEPLRLRIYGGADGEFALYEDDGVSFGFERGQFMLVGTRWNDAAGELRVSLLNGSKMLPPNPRKIEIELVQRGAKKSVLFTGKPLTVRIRYL